MSEWQESLGKKREGEKEGVEHARVQLANKAKQSVIS